MVVMGLKKRRMISKILLQVEILKSLKKSQGDKDNNAALLMNTSIVGYPPSRQGAITLHNEWRGQIGKTRKGRG